jgi:transcription termination factor Rho
VIAPESGRKIGADIPAAGILELGPRGSGFLRQRGRSYLPGPDDVHVPQGIVRRYRLRTGDDIDGFAEPGTRGRNPVLASVVTANGLEPAALARRPDFDRLSAIHPTERLTLEGGAAPGLKGTVNRLIDLLCPFGKGQRALIVAPSKAGKTTILQSIASGVALNHPEALLLILLVEERPEEVTEMERCGFGEVVASSFDFPPSRHVAVAEMSLERARRKVEAGGDVVLILDSITRLARAYNTLEGGTGKTLSGGFEATAMEKPKRFFGSARAVDPEQGGGSLTIIATALVDTGSRMDQVIFEEFKGTGNSELVLSRELADRRIFPAVDLQASATRREERLLSQDELAAAHAIRRRLAGKPPAQAMTELLAWFEGSPTNAQLVQRIAS